ncbi:MAG TPA: helix-hairpin-helix domain-containing protein [Solirubrobacteraceae bacterium]|nr:helix-hairpin-helix domain-containing protein [Solirubrobacteraceae bacterium]
MSDPTNSQIAAALDELGDLYELDGAIIHRVVAYRNAAKAVRDASESISALARQGRATELPGIGATIQEKVLALADTGQIPALEKLRARFPAGLVAMTHLPGLGPKRARRLYDELGIDSLQGLREAAESRRIRTLKGFGPKAEEALLNALTVFEAEGPTRRTVLSRAWRWGSGWSRRCAPIRPPTALSWQGRRGGWPRASRTSTSSPRPATRLPWHGRRPS